MEAEMVRRYVAGEPPTPAADTASEKASRTASELAYGQDGNEQEVKEKVAHYVKKEFAGDYQHAFGHFDPDLDGGLDRDALMQLLCAADVGNVFTRGEWADAILARLDKSGDAKVQWWEFENVVTKPEPIVPAVAAPTDATTDQKP